MKNLINNRLMLAALSAAVIAGVAAGVLMEINLHHFTYTTASVTLVALISLFAQAALVAAAWAIKARRRTAAGALLVLLALPGLCALTASFDPGTGANTRIIQAALLINTLLYIASGWALMFLKPDEVAGEAG
jgi:hypothetical protein